MTEPLTPEPATTTVYTCSNCGANVSDADAAKFEVDITAQPCPLCGGEFTGPHQITTPPEAA